MKQEIQEKLIRQTGYLTAQENLFSIVVETIEDYFSTITTFDGDSMFTADLDGKFYAIQSNEDNMYIGAGNIDVFIDVTDPNVATGRVAELVISMNGDTNENYYNPTVEDREAFFELFGKIKEAVQEFIDGGGTTPNNVDGESTIDA